MLLRDRPSRGNYRGAVSSNWLKYAVRSAIPEASPLAKAEFATIRERLIKIGARVIEHIARICILRDAANF